MPVWLIILLIISAIAAALVGGFLTAVRFSEKLFEKHKFVKPKIIVFKADKGVGSRTHGEDSST